MIRPIRTITLFACLVCLTACHEPARHSAERTRKDLQTVMALYDSMMHKSPHALELIEAQLRQARDSLTWYDYHLLYGRHYMLTEHPDSMLPYVERTLRFVASQPSSPRVRGLRGEALNAKAAYMHLFHQQPDSVISLFHQAYELMADSDDKTYLPDICANLGDAYTSVSDLPNASRWYRRALFLNDSLSLPKSQTLSIYMGLGRIYTMLRDFDQAGSYYQLADERIDELQPNLQSYLLNNYGNYYYFRKDYPQALAMFRRLKAHLERYDAQQNFDMYLCKINLADVFLNLGMTDSARHYLREPEEYFKEQHVDVGTYYAQTIRMGIALQEQRYDDAERIIREGAGLDVSDIDMRSIRKEYLNRYYAAVGDYRQAYQALASSITLTDSAEQQRRTMRSSDIMMRLTEDTIRLHHQLELQQREVRYAQTRNLSVVVIALLIIIILLFVIYSSQQRKRYLLTRLDMLSLRLLNARQRISPHFIFNVLNSRMVKADKAESQQLVMLANLIRTNLDLTQKTLVTLEEELDFVQQYIDIGRKASGLDITFTIDAPDRNVLRSVKLPSMLVQILAENAVLHGLKNKEGDKCLTVKVEDCGKEVRVSVIDNGPGFDIRKYNSARARTGLNIIRTTVSTINQENKKQKLAFDIHNDNGCHAILTITKDTKYPPP